MTGIILAAGKSKRMNSHLPKVLLPLNGSPLLSYVLKTAQDSGLKRIIVVVGKGHDEVKKAFIHNSVEFVLQNRLLGTADAVRTCEKLLTEDEEILVFCGDTPLLTSHTITKLAKVYKQERADVTLLTAILDNPYGYGRIVRDGNNQIQAIVEEREASEEIKKIREINSGAYIFRWRRLAPILNQLKPSRVSGEYYLTDAIAALKQTGAKIASYTTPHSSEILGVNTPEEFDQVAKILVQRDEKN
jgi:bifunctional UDP-N-acetylglucosamine pyrophosphorylase/glucosamine-1-phosphate N-acetyltransferase